MKNDERKLLSLLNLPLEKQEALLERLDFVEDLINPLNTAEERQEAESRYMEKTGCCKRTIRNYVKRYKDKGAFGLILYDREKDSRPLCSQELRDQVIFLIRENPGRSMPKIRELLLCNEVFHEEASRISERQFYRIAQQNGFDKKARSALMDNVKRSYRSFEASCSLELVQGDARDGIWIDCADGKKRKTYLFAWLDDFSRKILYAQYYWDEKLPCMEDSFRKMVLRYGLPKKLYLDNGSTYISNHFRFVIHDLGIKKTHHGAYKSYCKGKVEALMKKIKNDFQSEAQLAGFKTLEELNTAFHAWVNVKYDRQALSTTGEAPGERFIKGLSAEPKRIENLDEFMQYFLMRETRTVNKYGRVKLKGNTYPVKSAVHGKVVNVRYDPFDLTKIFIYDDSGLLIETTEPSILKNTTDKNIPEERKTPPGKVKESARNYFAGLRKLNMEAQRKSMPNLEFNKLFNTEENSNEQ